ncbi:MAG: non-heme iron oxygenase ferredoxin subunit [Alphaproteobacteria bacterium]|nr:non-heme iron oxygenase ferredoxin subunit [Alphaproteobacteria bacterium]
MAWVDAFAASEIDADDVKRFDHGERTYAVYRTAADTFHCTDGLCTHERVHLSGGFLIGHEIECPKHNGRFDIRTGQATCQPVSQPLATYPVRVDGGRVWIDLPEA